MVTMSETSYCSNSSSNNVVEDDDDRVVDDFGYDDELGDGNTFPGVGFDSRNNEDGSLELPEGFQEALMAMDTPPISPRVAGEGGGQHKRGGVFTAAELKRLLPEIYGE
jgi:hypothetical protein